MKLVWVWLGEGEAQGHPGDILKGTLVEKLGCIYKTASWGRDGMPHRIRWGLEKKYVFGGTQWTLFAGTRALLRDEFN